ncbi:MAG: serine protease [Nocardioidaceae bacterium]
MRNRTPTTPSRRARTSWTALTLIAVLGAVLTGCSGGRDDASTPAAASTSAHASASASAATSTAPVPRPSSSPRPPSDAESVATSRQLTGLVRIVASIGHDGRRETSTGMVLRDDGEVLTNNHAVAGATEVQVTVMGSGTTYSARVEATDPGHDVALLRLVGASGLSTVTLAARDADVGDAVTVVGDARGLRSRFTAATGTVLTRDQTLVTPASGSTRAERLTGVMLTSCDVVAGESGGPTYGADGRVVGMTTAAVRTGRSLDGVAIPLATLWTVIRDLERHATS